MIQNDQHGGNPVNLSFSAACHPLICTIGDELLPLLRHLCHGSRAAADAERKRLQVSLPDHPSEQQVPQPEHLAALLGRLPALTHVSITQHPDPDPLPSSSRSSPGDGPSETQGQPTGRTLCSFANKHTAPQPPSPRQTACYWLTSLSALRPQHLRSLELDGLVVRLQTHGSLSGTAPLTLASVAISPNNSSKAAPAPTTTTTTALDLVCQLLMAAPGLQELALLGVRVLKEQTVTGAVTGGAEPCGGGGWCSVFRALPEGLTTFKLGLSDASEVGLPRGTACTDPTPDDAAAPDAHVRAGAGAPAATGERGTAPGTAASAGQGCARSSCCCTCPPGWVCCTCLGAALRRLPRLKHLELSGLRAGVVLTALRIATAHHAPPCAGRVPGPGREDPRDPVCCGCGSCGHGGASAGPLQDVASAAALSAKTPPSLHSPQQHPPQAPEPKQQRPQQEQQQQEHHHHHQQQCAPCLSLLERLALDLAGHVCMDALREVLAAGLPRLGHLTVVEQRQPAAKQPPPPLPLPPPPPLLPSAVKAGDSELDASLNRCGHPKSPLARAYGEDCTCRTCRTCMQRPTVPTAAAAASAVAAAVSVAPRQHGEYSVAPGQGDEAAAEFTPLESMLWMLRRPELRRLSFTSDRSFTSLEPPAPSWDGGGAHPRIPAEEGPDGGAGGVGPGPDPAACYAADGSRLASVRLSFDLSAEALEPLVSCLPATVTSLTLNVGTLHRPSDVLAAYAASSTCYQRRCRGSGSGGTAEAAAESPPRLAPPPAALPPAALDSPAWLSIPPHSFLGGLRFLWPALTQLPRVVPSLRELRLGGGAAAACSDHVLRCWAGASGDPDSLATPMVVDPSFNAMVRHLQPRAQPPPYSQSLETHQHVMGGGHSQSRQPARVGVSAGSAAVADREVSVPHGSAANVAVRLNGGSVATAADAGEGHPGSWSRVQLAEGGGGGGGGGGGLAAVMGWSDWARSLERVCLMAHGPTVAGALHLRRFMTALRRLQLVVDGRLVEVAVAGAGGGGDGGGGGGAGVQYTL